MIFAPDSKLLRAVWFDRAFSAAKKADLADVRAERVGLLSPGDSMRLGVLCGQKQVIERLAKENPSLTVELLTSELAKLDALLDDFIELGRDHDARRAAHDDVRLRGHAPELARLHRAAEQGAARRSAAWTSPRRNLDVLRQRRGRYEDLRRTIEVTRGQMELIEQTFRLLGDEIMTMASPRELGGRIDELRARGGCGAGDDGRRVFGDRGRRDRRGESEAGVMTKSIGDKVLGWFIVDEGAGEGVPAAPEAERMPPPPPPARPPVARGPRARRGARSPRQGDRPHRVAAGGGPTST